MAADAETAKTPRATMVVRCFGEEAEAREYYREPGNQYHKEGDGNCDPRLREQEQARFSEILNGVQRPGLERALCLVPR